MDFLDPKKKRAHKIRLYIGYALMACALAIGSAILFFEARGFDISRRTGEIVQNGLVFVDSHPESADVTVNGKHEGTTDMRLTIPAGEYTFELSREGYRTWKRQFQLIGSTIERLNYAFLFPENLSSQNINTYEKAPSFSTQSLDRKWLIIQRPDNFSSFDIYDLGNQDRPPVRSISIPGSALKTNKRNNKIELVEWSTDNRHFIVKHSYRGGSEYILIDHEEPSDSINLSSHLDTNIFDVSMRDKKHDKLHILDKNGGTLRFYDIGTKNSSIVARDVFAYETYGEDVVFYVTARGANKGSVNVNIIKDDKDYKVRELPAGAKYPIDITRFDDEWYMAVGADSDKRAYIYHEVFKSLDAQPKKEPTPFSIFTLKSLEHISISANTRFIGVQGGNEFAVFDAEHNRRYQYDIDLKIPKGQKAEWMDGHRFAIVSENKMTVWDFDGINQQTLINANQSHLTFFDRDYDFLYAISPSDKQSGNAFLTKTPMRTEADL